MSVLKPMSYPDRSSQPDSIEQSQAEQKGADSIASRRCLSRLTLLCASSLTVMAGTPVAPALPTMEAAFADHPSRALLVRLMLTMPGLFIALLAPLSGWLVDRFGRRPLLLWGTVLYAAAGTSGLYLNSLWTILVGRALLGMAVAAVMTAAVTLIGDYFRGAERERFMGLQAAFMALGGVVFLLSGGILADVSWRGPFAIYLIALGVVPMVILSIREPARHSVHIRHSAIDDLRRTPLRTVGLIYVIAFLGMAAFYAIPVQLPFHLHRLTRADGTYVGLAIASMTLVSTGSAMLYPRLKARMSYQGVCALMLLGIGCGYLIVASGESYGWILVGMMISGLGLGLLMPNLNVWLINAAPEAIRGRLVGLLTMSLFLGQFMSPILLRVIPESWGTVGIFNVLGIGMLGVMPLFAGYELTHRWSGRTRSHPPMIAGVSAGKEI